jgi:uncharacterized protein (UPF0548 family)
MLFRYTMPDEAQLNALIESQKSLQPTYPTDIWARADFTKDENRILLGEGAAVWEAAQHALLAWAMFPYDWTRLYAQKRHYTEGGVVVLCTRILGLWWFNVSNISKIHNDLNLKGFTYSTLPNHAESGEEMFSIRRDAAGKIWYEIKAASRPHHFLVRWSFPLVRLFQKKFARHSLQQFYHITKKKFGTLNALDSQK